MDHYLPSHQCSLGTDAADMNMHWILQDQNQAFRLEYNATDHRGSLSPADSQTSFLTESSYPTTCGILDSFPLNQMTFPQFCERLVSNAEDLQSRCLLPEVQHGRLYDTSDTSSVEQRRQRRKGRPLASSPQDMSARAAKRREQNRAAQRTYRARKDDQISLMESRLAELVTVTQQLSKENKLLLEEVQRLKREKDIDSNEFQFT